MLALEHGVAAPQRAAVDAHKHHGAVVVGGQLEGEDGQRAVRVGGAGRFAGSGQVGDDGVQQRLDAAVAEGRAGQHGHEFVGDGRGTQAGAQRVDRGAFAAQPGGQQRVVALDDRFDQARAGGLGCGQQLGRNFGHARGRRRIVAVPDEGVHVEQVHDAAEFRLGADRQLQRQHARTQAFLHRRGDAQEVRARAVQLVDEGDARYAVFVGEAPVGLGLWFDAGHAVEDDDGTVEHAQRAAHFEVEVDVAGRVWAC